jgi:hypothetical protein
MRLIAVPLSAVCSPQIAERIDRPEDLGEETLLRPTRAGQACAATILQNRRDTFISALLSLEPRRICMIMSYSQIASARPKLDACLAH